MERRDGLFKGRSWVLYSPMQSRRDNMCCGSGRIPSGGRHFWLYPDRNKRGGGGQAVGRRASRTTRPCAGWLHQSGKWPVSDGKIILPEQRAGFVPQSRLVVLKWDMSFIWAGAGLDPDGRHMGLFQDTGCESTLHPAVQGFWAWSRRHDWRSPSSSEEAEEEQQRQERCLEARRGMARTG